MSETKTKFTLHFDGACKGNPGKGGYGGIIRSYSEGYKPLTILTYNGNIEYCTNNYSEYSGLLSGLKNALIYKIQNIDVYGDSQLVIKQMNGEYNVNSDNLVSLYNECKELEKQFEYIKFHYVPRKQNSIADSLANKGLSGNIE